jgi:hypothetical protein
LLKLDDTQVFGAIPINAQEYDNTDRRIQLTENENYITMAASRLLKTLIAKDKQQRRGNKFVQQGFLLSSSSLATLTPSL